MPNALSTDPALRERTIALVGLMGAGKSSIGRRLAHALDLPFKDADEEVERAAARSKSGHGQRNTSAPQRTHHGAYATSQCTVHTAFPLCDTVTFTCSSGVIWTSWLIACSITGPT